MAVSLAGTAAVRAAGARGIAGPAHGYTMHTLTVTGRNLAGGPDTGDQVLVFNADNTGRFLTADGNSSIFYHGTAKFSVPAGHYWALGYFVDISSTRKAVAERLDVLPQFTVTKATTVHLAERSADSEITTVTPRPSMVTATGFELRRLPRTGLPVWLYQVTNGSFPLWVSPVATPVTAGKLQDYTEQWRTSPAGAARPYDYDLAYGTTGRIPPQHFVARPGGLATVHTSYYSDIASRGVIGGLGLFRPQFADAVQVFFPAEVIPALPTRRTWYVTGNRAITWWNGAGLYDPPVFGLQGESGGQFSGPMTFRAGQMAAEKLNTFPLHPGGYDLGISYGRHVAPATRAGDVLRLDVTPFSDSSGDIGEGFFNGDKYLVAGGYQVDENGHKIAGGHVVSGPGRGVPVWAIRHFWQVKLGSKPSVITFTVAAARTRTRYPLSTSTTTTWTWRSAPVTGGRLPSGWVCSPDAPLVRNCAVQPMMTLSYHVARLALNESAPPGRQRLQPISPRWPGTSPSTTAPCPSRPAARG